MDIAKWYPPGYQFLPTDKELWGHYLKSKVNRIPIRDILMVERDVYGQQKPWAIFESVPGRSIYGDHNAEVYVVSLLRKKFPIRNRADRKVVAGGFWKITGKEIRGTTVSEGNKKTLNFKEYEDGGSGSESDWLELDYA